MLEPASIESSRIVMLNSSSDRCRVASAEFLPTLEKKTD